MSGCFEGEVLLCKITECHHKEGSDDFGEGRIPAKYFHKEFQESIIQTKATQYHQKIFTELFSFGHRCFLENHIAAQVKTCWKSYQKCRQKSRNMRTDGNEWQVQCFFLKNIVIGYEKQEDIQTGIKSAAGCIAVGLQGHNLFENRIKKIHNTQYKAPDMFV